MTIGSTSGTAVVIPVGPSTAAHSVVSALETVDSQTRSAEIVVLAWDRTDKPPIKVHEAIDSLGSICRVLFGPFGGAGPARNAALVEATKHAATEFVAFLDADDGWMPTHIEKGVAHIRATGDIYAGQAVFRSDVLGVSKVRGEGGRILSGHELVSVNPVTTSGVVAEAHWFVGWVPFDPELVRTQDRYCWFQLSLAGATLWLADTPTVLYRWDPTRLHLKAEMRSRFLTYRKLQAQSVLTTRMAFSMLVSDVRWVLAKGRRIFQAWNSSR